MAELMKGLRNAAVFERGVFLTPGFDGTLRIERCLIKDTFKSGVCFIVEMTVLESNHVQDPKTGTESHPNGSRVTWCQKLTDKSVAFPALKEFIYAVMGKRYNDPADRKYIEEKIDPVIEDLLYKACEKSTQIPEGENAFKDRLVDVRTHSKKTQGKGLDFTVHTWAPASRQAA